MVFARSSINNRQAVQHSCIDTNFCMFGITRLTIADSLAAQVERWCCFFFGLLETKSYNYKWKGNYHIWITSLISRGVEDCTKPQSSHKAENLGIIPKNPKKNKTSTYTPITLEKPTVELVNVTQDMKSFNAYDKLCIKRINELHIGTRMRKAAEAEKEEKK